MDKEKILKAISIWTEAEKTMLAGSEDGTWTHGRHYGSLEYLHQFKELLELPSFEEKALKSFEALVSSKECRQFMEDYYGGLEQEKVGSYCSKCEPAPGKMIPVTPRLPDGTIRCDNCNRVIA